ncbi:hypothetical protein BC830DRAFT_906356 [Chytriomyces sp. MP71]|nr:hypothetical protein BC830DRAFT_906356 [Chytriomyces sp. MP71]
MPPDGMYQHSYVANPDFFPLEPTAFVMGPPYPPQESFLFAQASTSHSHAFTPVHLQQLQHPLAPPPGLFPRPSPPAPANAATFDAFVSAPAAISGPRLIETETSQRMYSPSGYGPTPYAPRAVGSSYIEVAMSPARKSSFGTIGQNRSGALTTVEGAQPRDSGWSLF